MLQHLEHLFDNAKDCCVCQSQIAEMKDFPVQPVSIRVYTPLGVFFLSVAEHWTVI